MYSIYPTYNIIVFSISGNIIQTIRYKTIIFKKKSEY